ncbi:MAG: membrane integrity-associated transporter subunit PqiC [Candidatus Hydrogenedentes bacterium]|nr:membrane integrity-associated transporter subunit PqiC [Candidatus Hydrogenedentota bacterium]
MRILGLAAAGLAMVAGCATPALNTHFYTLDMNRANTAAEALNLDVDRLRPAEQISRKAIAIQKTPTELEYYANNEWAASLTELVTNKLETEFGLDDIRADPLLVSGTILSFGQLDVSNGTEADIVLELVFYTPAMSIAEPPLLNKTYTWRGPVEGALPGALVEELSRGLELVAAEIIADAKALQKR